MSQRNYGSQIDACMKIVVKNMKTTNQYQTFANNRPQLSPSP